MIKLKNTLRASSKIKRLAQHNDGRWVFASVLLAISVLGFLAPWSVTSNAGITLNAYDLAEWMSLSPIVHSEIPTRLTPFLLRLSLFFVVITLTRMPIFNWVKTGSILVFGVSMLPPLEILSNRQDPNYLQLLVVAIGGTICAFTSMALTLTPKLNRLVISVLCVLAILATSVSMIRMVQVFSELQILARVGLGYSIYILGMASTALISILPYRTKTG